MMLRRLCSVFLLSGLVLATLAASKNGPVDLTGTWKLNMGKSKGAPDWRPETTVVIVQGPHQIHFSYFLTPEAVQPFQSNSYVTNGKDQKLYITGSEKAYVSARWHNDKELNVRVRHIVSSEQADTDWVETDTWGLSSDGRTLVNKLSDGKLMIYDKLDKPKQ